MLYIFQNQRCDWIQGQYRLPSHTCSLSVYKPLRNHHRIAYELRASRFNVLFQPRSNPDPFVPAIECMIRPRTIHPPRQPDQSSHLPARAISIQSNAPKDISYAMARSIPTPTPAPAESCRCFRLHLPQKPRHRCILRIDGAGPFFLLAQSARRQYGAVSYLTSTARKAEVLDLSPSGKSPSRSREITRASKREKENSSVTGTDSDSSSTCLDLTCTEAEAIYLPLHIQHGCNVHAAKYLKLSSL